MNPEHIKVYKTDGDWYGECPCNEYLRDADAATVHAWAEAERERHRATAAATPADFDATAHIIYDATGFPVAERPLVDRSVFVTIDLAAAAPAMAVSV